MSKTRDEINSVFKEVSDWVSSEDDMDKLPDILAGIGVDLDALTDVILDTWPDMLMTSTIVGFRERMKTGQQQEQQGAFASEAITVAATMLSVQAYCAGVLDGREQKTQEEGV